MKNLEPSKFDLSRKHIRRKFLTNNESTYFAIITHKLHTMSRIDRSTTEVTFVDSHCTNLLNSITESIAGTLIVHAGVDLTGVVLTLKLHKQRVFKEILRLTKSSCSSKQEMMPIRSTLFWCLRNWCFVIWCFAIDVLYQLMFDSNDVYRQLCQLKFCVNWCLVSFDVWVIWCLCHLMFVSIDVCVIWCLCHLMFDSFDVCVIWCLRQLMFV